MPDRRVPGARQTQLVSECSIREQSSYPSNTLPWGRRRQGISLQTFGGASPLEPREEHFSGGADERTCTAHRPISGLDRMGSREALQYLIPLVMPMLIVVSHSSPITPCPTAHYTALTGWLLPHDFPMLPRGERQKGMDLTTGVLMWGAFSAKRTGGLFGVGHESQCFTPLLWLGRPHLALWRPGFQFD